MGSGFRWIEAKWTAAARRAPSGVPRGTFATSGWPGIAGAVTRSSTQPSPSSATWTKAHTDVGTTDELLMELFGGGHTPRVSGTRVGTPATG
jgi:hypothetical protein